MQEDKACSGHSILYILGSLCLRAYCHAYWGCRKAECLGCIGKFKGKDLCIFLTRKSLT